MSVPGVTAVIKRLSLICVVYGILLIELMYTEHRFVVSFFVRNAISNSFLCFTTGNNLHLSGSSVRPPAIYRLLCAMQ